MPPFDTSVFDAPVQIVRMGKLNPDSISLRYAGETDADEIPLTPDEHRLLKQLDPTVFTHKYRPAEQESILDLAARDIVRLVTPGAGIGAYSWALDVADDITLIRHPFDSGFICVSGGRSFDLVDLGRPLLDGMDGRRTVGEVTDAVQNRILSGPDGRTILENARKATGKTFYVLLCDAGMSLTKGLLDIGAAVALPARVTDDVTAGD
jgi:hypothetical protein